jgi:hypothetical protein
VVEDWGGLVEGSEAQEGWEKVWEVSEEGEDLENDQQVPEEGRTRRTTRTGVWSIWRGGGLGESNCH